MPAQLEFPDATASRAPVTARFDSSAAFWAALALMGHEPGRPVLVTFAFPVQLPGFRGSAARRVMRFFLDGKNHTPCYFSERATRRGYELINLPANLIVDFELLEAESKKQPNVAQLARRARKHFHPNLWRKLAAEIDADPVKATTYKSAREMRLVDIRPHFSPWALDCIARAIEEKKTFNVSGNGVKRNFRAEGHLCDDGQYCAWYSSEYIDCGNGSYYLLINATTATYREDD